MKKVMLLVFSVAAIFMFFGVMESHAQIKDVLATNTPSVEENLPFSRSFPSSNLFDEMEKEMDEMLNGFRQRSFSPGFNQFGIPGMNTVSLQGNSEIRQEGDNLIVAVDMPGHEKEAIDLRIKDNKLVIKSERKSQIEEKDGKKLYRREISYGSFSRVIPFPRKVIKEKVEASLNNGVLTVVAPIDTSVDENENGFKVNVK